MEETEKTVQEEKTEKEQEEKTEKEQEKKTEKEQEKKAGKDGKMSREKGAKGAAGPRQMDMLHGSLLDKILLFALPLAASSILQQLFNSADVAVVGRFAGSQALAAVGGNSSVVSLLINLFVGLSVGANVLIANYIGRGKKDQAQEAVHTAITIALISGIFLIFVGFLAARPLLSLMNTPEDVLDLAVIYLRIYFLGMPFVMLYNFGGAILRSVGDTRRPLYCLLISGMVNVCLNLFFVIVCKLSVAGVAIATVLANMVSSGLIVYFLVHEEGAIRLSLSRLSLKKEHALRMIQIGVPAGIQGMVFSLSNVCIQTAINGFGSNAVAGSAAAVNFEFFTYFVTNGFGQAAVTFTSQNFGAGELERCKKIFRLSMGCGLIFTGLMSMAFVLGRNLLIRVYTVEDPVIAYAMVRVLYVETFACLPVTYEVGGAALRGLGYSMLPAILTVIGSCGFRILWIYTVFQKFSDFFVLMVVYPVTWVITGSMVLAAYFIMRKKAFAGRREN